MELVDRVIHWREVIGLICICIVLIFTQWEVLRGLVTEGPAVLDSLFDIALLILLFIMAVVLVYEIRQTAAT